MLKTLVVLKFVKFNEINDLAWKNILPIYSKD